MFYCVKIIIKILRRLVRWNFFQNQIYRFLYTWNKKKSLPLGSYSTIIGIIYYTFVYVIIMEKWKKWKISTILSLFIFLSVKPNDLPLWYNNVLRFHLYNRCRPIQNYRSRKLSEIDLWGSYIDPNLNKLFNFVVPRCWLCMAVYLVSGNI